MNSHPIQRRPWAAVLLASPLLLAPGCKGGSSNSTVPRVTAPAAGAAVGGTTTIRWTGFGSGGDVTIELSDDGGATFGTTLAASTENDGAFPWDTTGEADGAAFRVRVRSEGRSATSGTFAVDNTAPVLTLGAPDGGELVGSSTTVTWTTTDDNPGTVLVELSSDSGATFPVTVAAAAPDSGSYAWDTSALSDGGTYRVRLTPTDGAGNVGAADASAADFEVDLTAPVVTLTSPVGGESLSGTSAVTWTTTDPNPGTVAISVSLDSGSSFTETVTAAAADTGSYPWATGTVPDSTTLRVRVVATDGAGNVSAPSESATDVSAENLRVSGPAHYRDSNGNGVIDSGDTLLVRFDKDISVGSPVSADFALPTASDSLGAGAAFALGPETDTLLITLGTSPVLRTRGVFDPQDTTTGSPSGFELADPITANAIQAVGSGVDAAPVGPVDVTVQPAELSTLAVSTVTPGRAALGDLDGDGDLDLVVAVTGTDSNQRWSGNGDQGWTQSQTFGTTDARDVALGDIDGDGDLDAVFAVFGPNEVWTNDGSGALFDSGQALGSGQSTSVALGDVDRDGDLDAVFGNDGGQPDRVWINNGSGVFGDSGQTLGTAGTRDLTLADMDGDGDLDIVFAADDAASGTWTNGGSGTFGPGGTIPQTEAQALAVGDLNRDGVLDVVLAVLGQNQVRLGNGSGGFGAGQFLGNNDNRGVVLLDLDGDGDLDIYTAKNLDSGKYWLNDGSGVFAEDTVDSAPDVATDVVAGQLDGDADVDLLVINDQGGYRPYRGSAAGGQPAASYTTTVLSDGPWQSGVPSVGDLDGDGDEDLLVPDVGAATRVLLSGGDGTFAAGASFGSDGGREGTLFDADRDGDLDYLQRLGAFGATADRLWIGDGAGGFTDSGLTLGVDTFAPGDLDGDGDVDLVVLTGTDLETWDGDGFGGFAPSGQTLAVTDAAAAAFGDLDGDGDIDVVVGGATDTRVYANDGSGAFTLGATLAGFTVTTALTLGDLDRDGDLDLLHASNAPMTNLRWGRNDGGLAFAAPQDAVGAPNAFSQLALRDLGEDGDLDVLAVDTGNQALFLLRGNGNGTFTFVPGLGITDVSGVAALDPDRDGDLDLYVARGNDLTPSATADQLRVLD